jgi:capsular polysaccharide biosynthesis protein
VRKSSLKLLNRVVKKLTVYVDKLNNRFTEEQSVKGNLYHVIDKFEVGKAILTIKDYSIEKVRPYEIHGAIKNIRFDVEYPAIHLMEYENVRFFAESDFILHGNHVIWDKRNYPMFSKMIPQDKDLLGFDEKTVRISIEKEIVEFETAFSMCGVHSTVWSHFLVQYLPKIYFFAQFAEKQNEQITIILPEYTDKQVIEVVEYYTKDISNTTISTLRHNQSAHCKKLLYIESMSMISDHEMYETYIDFFVPECVTSFLRTKFVPDCIQKYSIKDKGQKTKLYIVRKNASYRNLLNIEEIEAFFRAEGYTFIEPHLLTMSEKIELFYNATEVAGPYSAGFSNIQFCRPGAKICLLSNIHRSFETYLSYFVDQHDIRFVAVTGVDNDNNSHSDYKISIEKVKDAYNQLFKN